MGYSEDLGFGETNDDTGVSVQLHMVMVFTISFTNLAIQYYSSKVDIFCFISNGPFLCFDLKSIGPNFLSYFNDFINRGIRLAKFLPI